MYSFAQQHNISLINYDHVILNLFQFIFIPQLEQFIMKSFNSYIFGSTNIYETAVPFYYLLKFFGLASFHFDLAKEKCGMRLQDYFVFLVSIVIYIIIFITASIDTLNDMKNVKTILDNGFVYQYISMIVYTILMVCYGFLKRNHVIKFLDLLYYFDESVDILNWRIKVNHTKDRTILIVSIVILLLPSGIMSCLWILLYADSSALDFRNVIFSVYIALTHIVVLFQFILSSCAVRTRYEILNQNMR